MELYIISQKGSKHFPSHLSIQPYFFSSIGVVSLCRLCATVIARDGRDLSTYALSPNFLPYKLIDQAMKTFRDSKPIVMEHFF